MDVVSVYIGVRLGLYRALADRGPSSSAELADGCGPERALRPRVARAAGDDGHPRRRRRAAASRLPPGHDEALLDETSLNYIAPRREARRRVRPPDRRACSTRSGAATASRTPTTAPTCTRVRRSSRGRCSTHLLGSEWFPAIPDVHERLAPIRRLASPTSACGQGYSTMAIARAYPKARVDGIDLDEASIAAARENLAGSGVEDRVTFHDRDAADPRLQGQYDLVYIHEALHDMSYPVDVLARVPRPARRRRVARRRRRAGGRHVHRRPATTSSASATASASSTACRSGWSARAPRERARSCAPTPLRRLRRGSGLRRLRGAADRERLLPLLPPDAVACRRGSRSSGRSGSGKTTVARRLAEQHGLRHVELDALLWGPNWTRAQRDEFRARVEDAISRRCWVADGNYTGKLGDLVLERADLVVWLDLPLPTIAPRLWRGHCSGCASARSSGAATARPGAVRSSAATRCSSGR